MHINYKNKKSGFSLAEALMTLFIMSVVMIVTMPIMTVPKQIAKKASTNGKIPTNWTTPNLGNDIYNTNTGKVGIGTSTPDNIFQVANYIDIQTISSTANTIIGNQYSEDNDAFCGTGGWGTEALGYNAQCGSSGGENVAVGYYSMAYNKPNSSYNTAVGWE